MIEINVLYLVLEEQTIAVHVYKYIYIYLLVDFFLYVHSHCSIDKFLVDLKNAHNISYLL